MTNPKVNRERRWTEEGETSPDRPVENRRDRILAAAAEEFEAKGFAGARIDEIARRSRVNKQLIYYYFESKRILHSKVMEHVTTRALEVTHDDSDHSYLKSVLRTSAASFSKIRNRLYRYWLWEAVEGSSQEEIARHDERQEHYAQKVAQIRKAQLDGEIDPDIDARFLHLAVTAIISFPHMAPQIASLVTGLEPGDPEFKEAQQAFLDHLMRGLLPPPDKS
ncbi:MAG TPA: TetR/AcrR family transcriptional regulator [Streptomyces sp.]|uniref:TetR/AcrR family transcriptional regulator n=1 Tax=Streptomyces sp. TaxID=1931 RepID=UPI002CEF9C8A|nr:TetR/AcrR family transcriptional regulator [Streptomyces sp.]HWU07668.1 TetR/AcrR family transcriptional regulator [Streptomyces sp.]